jgi:FkbM family methyltransferase
MTIDELIEQTTEGWWAPKGDRKLLSTRAFKMLEGEDHHFISVIRTHIVPGSVVIDVGANIGDHTIGYLKECGPNGIVLAYEPHPIAFECLKRNVPEAMSFNLALGDEVRSSFLCLQGGEDQGSSYLSDNPSDFSVEVTTLDAHLGSLVLGTKKLSVIKIDAEGSEVEILNGASKTISKHRPVLVIEVHRDQLAKRNHGPREILGFVEYNGYIYSFPDPGGSWDALRSDVICTPR